MGMKRIDEQSFKTTVRQEGLSPQQKWDAVPDLVGLRHCQCRANRAVSES
jgi:hypothetical protein